MCDVDVCLSDTGEKQIQFVVANSFWSKQVMFVGTQSLPIEQPFMWKCCAGLRPSPETAALQDALIHGMKILGWYFHHTRQIQPDADIPLSADRYLIGQAGALPLGWPAPIDLGEACLQTEL